MKKVLHEIAPEKPKRGRPVSSNPKLDGIRIRLTVDELAAITTAAGDIRVSEWARDALAKAAKRSTNMTLTTCQK
jgi:hypothetical protein